MEYIFGTTNRNGSINENLKTVGDVHSDLSGFVEIKRSYPDCDIVDKFRVVKKYKFDTNSEGKCYDWYVIDNHYRYIDSTKVPNEKIGGLENTTAALEDALCEMDAINEERIAAIEDALCEIDMG